MSGVSCFIVIAISIAQIAGAHPDQMSRVAQLLEENIKVTIPTAGRVEHAKNTVVSGKESTKSLEGGKAWELRG